MFVVFEGVDGSGKSTQLDWLYAKLCAEGYDVVVTRWNSSSMLSHIIKKAKRAQKMTPVTFAIMQAGDAAVQLKEVVLPALRQGKIVLSDRFFYTSLARDAVRGMDPIWLRSLFNFAVSPDLVMYFKVPVDTAISRVVSRRKEIRREKRKKLLARRKKEDQGERRFLDEGDSDDDNQSDAEEDWTTIPTSEDAKQKEEEEDDQTPQLNFYEAGLDCHLSNDPLENFHLFQKQVMDKYDHMVVEYGFKVIDATMTREQMFESVQLHVASALIRKRGTVLRCAEADPLALKECGWFKDTRSVAERMELCWKARLPLHMFFRTTLIPMRTRFSRIMAEPLRDAPVVLLHGNPHVDNYAKTPRGSAMIDFDRSCYGPYPFDIARFLVSLSIYQEPSNSGGFLPGTVLEAFKDGYLRGCTQPHFRFLEMRALQRRSTGHFPATVAQCLQAEKGWAKQLRDNLVYSWDSQQSIPEDVMTLLQGYLRSRDEESLLETYRVEQVGTAQGSMGLARYLVVLAPIEDEDRDKLFLDLKSVIDCPPVSEDGLYTNSFDHDGKRMIEASRLYAPGCTQGEGFATLNGKEYYGRHIPAWKDKLKGTMDEESLVDLALAVGSQLGRGHQLSLSRSKGAKQHAGSGSSSYLATHFRDNYEDIVDAASTLKLELTTAYYRLC